MKKFLILILLTTILLLSSCSREPEPINFGVDQCELCRMTISDSKFGAEIVTKKGKIYKFDAAECMLNYIGIDKIKYGDVAGFYVIDVLRPGELKDAATCYYLISENFPSPMGANLSAYSNQEDVISQQKRHGGEVRSWDELQKHFKIK
ncbi:MAG: nitrous oxide reductase accessory protein NosL [Ignavibacteria bacterium]|nr:nitrous oxide reductase accessory protein NosL [Ignavibacteria bacterium]